MYYIMSDIHGCFNEFKQALRYWNPGTEKLMILGDLIDRGPDSLNVIRYIQKLKTDNPDNVIVLKGNHDESLINWLFNTPKEELAFYYMPSHDATMLSFHDDKAHFQHNTRTQRALHLRDTFRNEMLFLNDLPLCHETQHLIFVHAGINLNIPNWQDDTACMNHIRNPFLYSDKPAPKRVFFGHTPTTIIRNTPKNKPDDSIWISEDKTKIGIDGGVSMGGQLNAVKADEYGNIQDVIIIPAQA